MSLPSGGLSMSTTTKMIRGNLGILSSRKQAAILLFLLLGITACTPSTSTESQSVTETLPPPVIKSVTQTPTPDPWADSLAAFDHVVSFVETNYPERASLSQLSWEKVAQESQESLVIRFTSGDWKVSTFESALHQEGSLIEVAVKNEMTGFLWEGYNEREEVVGWVVSGGWVPKSMGSNAGDEWLEYSNERYGYRFEYPPDALVIESGVGFFDVEEKPEHLSNRDFFYELYERIGSNLCVRVELGDGYILFDAPENHSVKYTYCRRFGQQTGEYYDHSLEVGVDGEIYKAEGKEFLQTGADNPERDEWYVVNLSSGMRIEFGAESYDGERFEAYEEAVLPTLIQILETYQTLP